MRSSCMPKLPGKLHVSPILPDRHLMFGISRASVLQSEAVGLTNRDKGEQYGGFLAASSIVVVFMTQQAEGMKSFLSAR